MGISIQQRKEKALDKVKWHLPKGVTLDDALDIAEVVIDYYIANGKEPGRCKGLFKNGCGAILGNRNTTGLCRRCYKNNYRSSDKEKRLDMLRQRYYRKKRHEQESDK